MADQSGKSPTASSPRRGKARRSLAGDPYAALEDAFRNVVGCLIGDPHRDIDGLSTFPDATGCLYIGTWQGHSP
jgi:hypothetical protein